MNNRLLWKTIFQYKRNNIFIRNMVLVFLLICIPLSSLTVVFSLIYNRSLKQNMDIYYSTKLEEISNQFNDVINILNSHYNAISTNHSYINWLDTDDYADAATLSDDIYEIKRTLSSSVLSIPHLDSVYLYKLRTDYIFSLNRANYFSRFDDTAWYDRFCANQSHDLMCFRTFRGNDYVTMCRAVYADDRTLSGVIVFNFEASEFRKFFLSDSNSAKITITARPGYTVFSDSESSDPNGYTAYECDCIESFYNIRVLFDSGIFSDQQRLSSLSITVSIVFVVLASVIIAVSVSMRFYSSPFKIINIFGNESAEADEMPFEMNTIIKNMLRLKEKNAEIEEVLAEKISALKKSQILTLQEQINPHFIFNALNLISMTDMAEHKKQTNITRIIKLLSDILKGVLDTENYTCSFATELEYVEKYIQLQNIKFDDHINFVMNIEENTMPLSCVKFMLQPIIENAINHGILHNPGGFGTITITAGKHSDCFKITVSDDGPGIPPEKLSSLREALSSLSMPHKKHIGIANVHNRIHLIYGDPYGLEISSNGGTEITYTLPILPYRK